MNLVRNIGLTLGGHFKQGQQSADLSRDVDFVEEEFRVALGGHGGLAKDAHAFLEQPVECVKFGLDAVHMGFECRRVNDHVGADHLFEHQAGGGRGLGRGLLDGDDGVLGRLRDLREQGVEGLAVGDLLVAISHAFDHRLQLVHAGDEDFADLGGQRQPSAAEVVQHRFQVVPETFDVQQAEEAAVALDGVDRAEDCVDRAASLAFVGQLHEVGVELEQTGVGLLQEGGDQCAVDGYIRLGHSL